MKKQLQPQIHDDSKSFHLKNIQSPIMLEWGMSDQKKSHPTYITSNNTLINLSQNIHRFQIHKQNRKFNKKILPSENQKYKDVKIQSDKQKNSVNFIKRIVHLNRKHHLSQRQTYPNKSVNIIKSVDLKFGHSERSKKKLQKNQIVKQTNFLKTINMKLIKNSFEGWNNNKQNSRFDNLISEQNEIFCKVNKLNKKDIINSNIQSIFNIKQIKQHEQTFGDSHKNRLKNIRKHKKMNILDSIQNCTDIWKNLR